jgi:hypothetical protein
MKRGRDHWKSLDYVALLKDDSLLIFGTNVNVQPFNPYDQAVTKLWHAGAVLVWWTWRRVQERCGGHAAVEEHRF